MSDTAINNISFSNFSEPKAYGSKDFAAKAIKYSPTSLANFGKKVAKIVDKISTKVKEHKEAAAIGAYSEALNLAAENNYSNITSHAEAVIEKYGKVVKLETLLNGLNKILFMLDKSQPRPIKVGTGQFKLFGKNAEALMALRFVKHKEFNGFGDVMPTPTSNVIEERAGNYMEALFGAKDKIISDIAGQPNPVPQLPIKDDSSSFKSINDLKEFGNDPLDDFTRVREGIDNERPNSKATSNELGITTSYMGDITPEARDLGIEALNTEIARLKEKELPQLATAENQAKTSYDESEKEVERWQQQLEVTQKEVEKRKAEERAAKARELAVLREQQDTMNRSIDSYNSKAATNLQRAAALREEVARLMADASSPITPDEISKRH